MRFLIAFPSRRKVIGRSAKVALRSALPSIMACVARGPGRSKNSTRTPSSA